MNKKEFAKVTLDEISKTFIVHVTILEAQLAKLSTHLNKEAQIAFLLIKKVIILKKYSDFPDIFLEQKVLVLLQQTNLNKHAIELEKDKQPIYWPIYSLGSVELEILKMYNKTNLKIKFIWPFKPFASAFILFDKKQDSSFWLCVDYSSLNNLTINNQYPLSFIGKSLNRLS